MKSAIASCYCLDQSPGAEQYGGLSIVMRRRQGATGSIEAIPKDHRTGAMLNGIDDYIAEAKRGVTDAAMECGVDLDLFDIVLNDFAHHLVDSKSKCFYGAAKIAFRSAWAAWNRFQEEYR